MCTCLYGPGREARQQLLLLYRNAGPLRQVRLEVAEADIAAQACTEGPHASLAARSMGKVLV